MPNAGSTVVANEEETGPRPRRFRLESHGDGAVSAPAHEAPAGVGLGEIPGGSDGVDHERDSARVGQPDRLGAAAGSHGYGREGE